MKRWYLTLIPFFFAAAPAQAVNLPAINETPEYTNIEIDKGHSSADVFRHFSSECSSGKVLFLGTLRDGRHLRLTLLSGNEAASYIETDGDGKYPWLLACDGAKKFLVEKEHRYGTNSGARFFLFRGRALEGVDYLEKRPSRVQTVVASADDDAFAGKMASELSGHGMDFIATNQGTRFEGKLVSRTGECDTISIKRFSNGASESAVRDFKVCSGRVYPLDRELAMNRGK